MPVLAGEKNSTLDGNRKAAYQKGADGKITLVASHGTSYEEAVTLQAVVAFEQQTQDARVRFQQGLASPLEWRMYSARMDVRLLSQSTGIWAFRIRRHFHPARFCRLSPSILTRYATALSLTLEELTSEI